MEKMKTELIKFWKDNLLSEEHSKHVAEIISDFYYSDHMAKQNFDAGWPFERSILLFMSNVYGTFDPLTDAQYKALYDTFRTFEDTDIFLNQN